MWYNYSHSLFTDIDTECKNLAKLQVSQVCVCVCVCACVRAHAVSLHTFAHLPSEE